MVRRRPSSTRGDRARMMFHRRLAARLWVPLAWSRGSDLPAGPRRARRARARKPGQAALPPARGASVPRPGPHAVSFGARAVAGRGRGSIERRADLRRGPLARAARRRLYSERAPHLRACRTTWQAGAWSIDRGRYRRSLRRRAPQVWHDSDTASCTTGAARWHPSQECSAFLSEGPVFTMSRSQYSRLSGGSIRRCMSGALMGGHRRLTA